MSLNEVLPDVRALSRFDKLRLIQLVAQELEQDEAALIEQSQTYPIWSPIEAFDAAAELLKAVESGAGRP